MGDNASASGNRSTALGYNASADEYGSTALGVCANASGKCSTALGVFVNAGGIDSIAIGKSARANSNCAIALGSNASALPAYAIVIGEDASVDDPGVDSSSIAIGRGAKITNHYNSTAIGSNSSVTGNCSTAIGFAASTSNSYSIQLGDPNNLSSITSKVTIITNSDERDKTDIEDVNAKSVEFLKKVRVIRYVFNGRGMYIDDEENLSDEDKEKKRKYGLCAYDREAHAAGTKKGERKRIGVSAQGVQKALEETFGSASYANLVNDNFFDLDKAEIPDDVENQLAVNYEGFIPFLIKAVQELDERLAKIEGVQES